MEARVLIAWITPKATRGLAASDPGEVMDVLGHSGTGRGQGGKPDSGIPR